MLAADADNALLCATGMEESMPRVVLRAALQISGPLVLRKLLAARKLAVQYAGRAAVGAEVHFGSSLLATRRTNGTDMISLLFWLLRCWAMSLRWVETRG